MVDIACGSCGKRVLCVFQGAVGAFFASTAPAASIGSAAMFNDSVRELGHPVTSARCVLRQRSASRRLAP